MMMANTLLRVRATGLSVGLLALGCGDSTGEGNETGASTTGTGPGPSTTPTPTANAETVDSPPGSVTSTSTSSSGTPPDPDSGSSSDESTGEPMPPPEGSFWVFVTADQRVSRWSMDPADGALTLEQEIDIGTNLGPLAVRPDLGTLYVGLLNDEARAYTIDPQTAELSPNGTVDLGFRPVYLSTDRTGSYLLSATFNGDEIAVFPVGPDGSLGGDALQRLDTPEEPHAILTDASNGWVFVPHRTPDVVGQYALDPATGMLTPNAVSEVASIPGAGPRHLVFHPNGDYAYLANEFDDSVSTFAFDAGSGQLALQATISTIPDDFPGNNNTCADIHITPDGRFVYVSNRGHDSLAVFRVDAGNGELTAQGQVATEPRPREFEVSPRGRYVYAAGQDSGMLASYAVDDATGELTPGPVYDVGTDPRWVLAVELPPR